MLNHPSTDLSLDWRRTKIIATLGPATSQSTQITQFIQQGVNIFRLNMSHGIHEEHKKTFLRIREIATSLDKTIAILIDLCGPKIRTGRFKDGGIFLHDQSLVEIHCDLTVGHDNIITSQYPLLYKDVNVGERILLDDGNLELMVENISEKTLYCRVIHGGKLSNNKGINLPDSQLSLSSLTEKDQIDLQLALDLKADFVALSFVRDQHAIIELKARMQKQNRSIPIIAKIEKPEAVKNIDSILNHAYGIMIARGDLGIELPAEQVPLIQKELIAKARQRHRPVIVATQMLESMISHSRPTRAEVSDVANAAMLGTDAVMLSGETAIGKYPIEAVSMMDKILREVERHQWENNEFSLGEQKDKLQGQPSVREAVSHAAVSLTLELCLQGIIIPTTTGTTARVLSANRPKAPMVGISSHANICRMLCLSWGVIPIKINPEESRNWKQLTIHLSEKCALSKKGNTVLFVSGFRDTEEFNEPVLKIIKI